MALRSLCVSALLCVTVSLQAGEEPSMSSSNSQQEYLNGLQRTNGSAGPSSTGKSEVSRNERSSAGHKFYSSDTSDVSKGIISAKESGNIEEMIEMEKQRVRYLEQVKKRMVLEKATGSSADSIDINSFDVEGLHVMKVWGKDGERKALLRLFGRYMKVENGDQILPNARVLNLTPSGVSFEINGRPIKLGFSSEERLQQEIQQMQAAGQDSGGNMAVPVFGPQ